MNQLRHLRRNADLSQRDFAGLLDVPLDTFRMWDSGLRPVPTRMLLRALMINAGSNREAATPVRDSMREKASGA